MDVLSQSEIDALLKKLLSDATVLPNDSSSSKAEAFQEKASEKLHISI